MIAKLPHMILEGIFTHFARADEKDKTAAYEQLRLFQQMIAMLEERGITIPYHHCSNSAGIVEMKEANMDIVRAGITLYGLWPSDEVDKSKISLKPVLSLKSHVAYVKTLEPDTLLKISRNYYQDAEHVKAIIQLNQIENPDYIYPGMVLKLP